MSAARIGRSHHRLNPVRTFRGRTRAAPVRTIGSIPYPFPVMASYVTGTDANFEDEVLNTDQPVLVDFWATWCGPCRTIAPTIEKLAADYEGRAKIVKLDVDNNPQTAMKYGIRSIPSLLFFKDGRPVDQMVGVVPERVLADKLDALATQAA